MRVGERMWVANRHLASRQLWLSSPVSGPRRFTASASGSAAAQQQARWLAPSKTGSAQPDDLTELLQRELSAAMSRDVRFE